MQGTYFPLTQQQQSGYASMQVQQNAAQIAALQQQLTNQQAWNAFLQQQAFENEFQNDVARLTEQQQQQQQMYQQMQQQAFNNEFQNDVALLTAQQQQQQSFHPCAVCPSFVALILSCR